MNTRTRTRIRAAAFVAAAALALLTVAPNAAAFGCHHHDDDDKDFDLAAYEMARPWGVEFNVVWPFVPGVEIYTAKATRTLWAGDYASGDLTFGVLVRPGVEDENAETFREFGLNLGYRQYFWKRAHLELALYPTWAIVEGNKADGEDYSGFALTTEAYYGYRFDLGGWRYYKDDRPDDRRVVWYLMPQVGGGYTVYSDLGPTSEDEKPFWTLNLQVGAQF
jgi:hypothetical protein